MKTSMISKVTSFLHQFSLVHQLSLLQSEMESLARKEAHFMAMSEKAIALLSARQ